MKIHDSFPQGSLRWFEVRLGKVTASEFDEFMTTDFELRKSQTATSYRYKKLAELLTGSPLPGFGGSWDMEQGQIRQDEAVPWFELEYDLEVNQVAFIETDDGRAGCSPDGLIGEDAGLEVKCPRADTHLRYVDEGGIPSQYLAQVYGSLWVTGRARWHFLSYHRGLPPLHVVIERDEAIMEKIGNALGGFYKAFDAALGRLAPERLSLL